MNALSTKNRNGYLLTVPLTMERYNLGRATVMQIATDNDCILKFGKSVRIDWKAFEKALELYRV